MGVLQGTFDTLSLTEVLGLLAQSRKSGALWLEAESVHGRVYLDGGRCCAAESDEVNAPLEADDALGQRLVDVCFSVARHGGGSFKFVADDEAPWKASPVEVDDAVDRLAGLLEEWREIQAVIPSLEVRPVLAPELGTDTIIVDQARWRLLVTLDGRRSVRDVMHATQRSVLDICNALKELVEEGAVEIAAALEVAPAPAAQPSAPVAAGLGALHELATVATEMPDPFAGADDEPVAAEPAADDELEAQAETEAEPDADDDAVDDTAEDATDEDATDEDATGEAATDDAPVDESAVAEDDTADTDTETETAVAHSAVGEPLPTLNPNGLDETDPRDRGALLRLFSALRDT
jgi:hypothetical protein